MRRERSYYMLCQRNETGVYSPEFGDYDKECVVFERQCYRDQGARARDLRIVKCRSARMSDVNAACAALS